MNLPNSPATLHQTPRPSPRPGICHKRPNRPHLWAWLPWHRNSWGAGNHQRGERQTALTTDKWLWLAEQATLFVGSFPHLCGKYPDNYIVAFYCRIQLTFQLHSSFRRSRRTNVRGVLSGGVPHYFGGGVPPRPMGVARTKTPSLNQGPLFQDTLGFFQEPGCSITLWKRRNYLFRFKIGELSIDVSRRESSLGGHMDVKPIWD